MAEPSYTPLGCIGMIAFFAVELAIGIGVTMLTAGGIKAVFDALGWNGQDGFFSVVAICIGLVVACFPVFWIDRWAKRITGHSVLDNLPFIP